MFVADSTNTSPFLISEKFQSLASTLIAPFSTLLHLSSMQGFSKELSLSGPICLPSRYVPGERPRPSEDITKGRREGGTIRAVAAASQLIKTSRARKTRQILDPVSRSYHSILLRRSVPASQRVGFTSSGEP